MANVAMAEMKTRSLGFGFDRVAGRGLKSAACCADGWQLPLSLYHIGTWDMRRGIHIDDFNGRTLRCLLLQSDQDAQVVLVIVPVNLVSRDFTIRGFDLRFCIELIPTLGRKSHNHTTISRSVVPIRISLFDSFQSEPFR